MKTNRRYFLKTAGCSAGAIGVLNQSILAAEPARQPSFLTRSPSMKLGTVTYNLAQDWDVPTIIKNCEAAGFQGVELRTSHKHGVEVSLSKEQRAEVRKQFANSKIELMGLGSAFDYHTPDQQKLRKDIEA